MVTRRGTTNTNARGSAEDRRRRKAYLLEHYGDGVMVRCHSCPATLTADTLQVDRIIPGALGGTYARKNIRPVCGPCNRRDGNAVREGLRRRTPKRTLIRQHREGVFA